MDWRGGDATVSPRRTSNACESTRTSQGSHGERPEIAQEMSTVLAQRRWKARRRARYDLDAEAKKRSMVDRARKRSRVDRDSRPPRRVSGRR